MTLNLDHATDGRGSWRTSFAPTSTPAIAAVGRCAGATPFDHHRVAVESTVSGEGGPLAARIGRQHAHEVEGAAVGADGRRAVDVHARGSRGEAGRRRR